MSLTGTSGLAIANDATCPQSGCAGGTGCRCSKECSRRASTCASSDHRPARTRAFPLIRRWSLTCALQITGPLEAPASAKQHEGYSGIKIRDLEVQLSVRRFLLALCVGTGRVQEHTREAWARLEPDFILLHIGITALRYAVCRMPCAVCSVRTLCGLAVGIGSPDVDADAAFRHKRSVARRPAKLHG